LRNHFQITSLKREKLAQANLAEKFTLQVSPERYTARLSESFVNKIGCSLKCFHPGEKVSSPRREYFRLGEIGPRAWVLSGLFSLKRQISRLGKMDFCSGEIIFAQSKKNIFFFFFSTILLFFSSYFLLSFFYISFYVNILWFKTILCLSRRV